MVPLRFLLECGCDTSASKFNGRTAFHRAIERGSINCVKTFIEFGVEVDSRDSEGRTGLHMAADYGHHAILKWVYVMLQKAWHEGLCYCLTKRGEGCPRKNMNTTNQLGHAPLIFSMGDSQLALPLRQKKKIFNTTPPPSHRVFFLDSPNTSLLILLWQRR